MESSLKDKIEDGRSLLNQANAGLFSVIGKCDAPKPGGPLTTRQPAEYKWRSGYPTPL